MNKLEFTHNAEPTLGVEIVGSGNGRPVNLVLPQARLDAVRGDAARWRPAR